VPVQIDTDQDTLDQLEHAWATYCQHGAHARHSDGHSDDAPVLEVQALPVPCCGRTASTRYLCQSWCAANPFLRCSACGKRDLRFGDCYQILGTQ
jgi:hypothetical protein